MHWRNAIVGAAGTTFLLSVLADVPGQPVAPASDAITDKWILLPAQIHDGMPIVEVEANGHRGLFGLDTGAARSVVDGAWAKAAGLETARRQRPRSKEKEIDKLIEFAPSLDLGGTQYVVSMTLDIGPERHSVWTVPVYDMSDLTKSSEVEIVGLLGTDYLQNRVIRLDYRRGTVERLESGRLRAPHDAGAVLPVTFGRDNRPMATVLVKPRGKEAVGALAMIDTGCGWSVWASRAFLKRLHMPLNSADAPLKAQSIVGARDYHPIALESLTMAGLTFRPLDAGGAGDPLNDSYDLLVGSDLFADTVVTLDYQNSRLILNPGTHDGVVRLQPSLGVTGMGTPDGPSVHSVTIGSRADQAGLRAGDVLVRIQSQDVSKFDPLAVRDLVRAELDAGNAIELIVKRSGGELRLLVEGEPRPK